MRKNRAILILLVTLLVTGSLQAQAVLLSPDGYTQSFDGLSSTGPAGTLTTWTDNVIIPGWYAYHGRKSTSYTPGAPLNYFVDDGSSSTGGEGLRSYGSIAAPDRALGEMSSTADTIPFAFAVRLANRTGSPITKFTVSYRGEQWRQNTGAQALLFDYQAGASSIIAGAWTEVPALNFLPLKNGTAAPLDGNAVGNFAAKSGSITAAVADGQEIWLRWTKKGTASCGLAVDDLVVLSEPAAQPVSLTFSHVTATALTISFAAAAPAATGYLVLRREGSAPAALPVDGTTYAPGNVLGDALVVSAGRDTVVSQSGLIPATEYFYAVYAFNRNGNAASYRSANPLSGSRTTMVSRSSVSSDVVAIPSSGSAVLSSLINDVSPLTASNGIQVWQFTVRDGGTAPDADAKPTILTGVTLMQGSANAVPDWSRSILAADLFDGTTRLASAVISAQSLGFHGFTLTVPDDSTKLLSLRLSLAKSNLSDHRQIQCSLLPENIITESDSLSSQMTAFLPASSDVNSNVIQVVATALHFMQTPSSAVAGLPLSRVIVAAADINGNCDVDFEGTIGVTANGAVLTGAPVSASALSGLAIYDSLTFSTTGASVTLTASAGSWITSSTAFQVFAHRSFYVDSITGRDDADGLSPLTAWRTLSRVNATVFQPGDSLLFRSGCSWSGRLSPMGSGDSVASIVIDMYGGMTKPAINGNGIIGTGAVYFSNQQYWEVNNLEITNTGATGADRRGIYITASNAGTVHHWYLRNLYIHNVTGTIGDAVSDKRTAGIGIDVANDGQKATRYDDILIEGCVIAYCSNEGLYTETAASSDYPLSAAWMNRRFTNVRIRDNVIHHISKNAMIIRYFDGGVIERNVCYETATGTTGNTMFTIGCNGTVFQYNEGYFNRASLQGGNFGDGSMYDADLRSMNITFQYSYSHDNSHGLLWTCTEQADSNIVCRYNVSKNDQGNIFCISYPNTSVYIYNNTVYCGAGTSPRIISERNFNAGTRKYFFYNNIIYNLSPTVQSYDFKSSGYTRIIGNNLFYGVHPGNEPQDQPKLTADPQFESLVPGFTTGLISAAGFALNPASPAINAGTVVPGRPDRDYLGNAVPSGGGIDIGAFEFQSSNGVTVKGSSVPLVTQLAQNFPNPFNPVTTLEFSVAVTGDASLDVYSMLGVKIAALFRGTAQAGRSYRAAFDGTQYSSGVYLYTLTTGSTVVAKKMILMK